MNLEKATKDFWMNHNDHVSTGVGIVVFSLVVLGWVAWEIRRLKHDESRRSYLLLVGLGGIGMVILLVSGIARILKG